MFCLDCFGGGDEKRRGLLGAELENLRQELHSATLTISALSASLDEERSNSARLAKQLGPSSSAALHKVSSAAAHALERTKENNQENVPNRSGVNRSGVPFVSPPMAQCGHAVQYWAKSPLAGLRGGECG